MFGEKKSGIELKARNGKIHYLELHNTLRYSTPHAKIRTDEEMVNQVNSVLDKMQENGYEIVSVETSTTAVAPSAGIVHCLTVILYK